MVRIFYSGEGKESLDQDQRRNHGRLDRTTYMDGLSGKEFRAQARHGLFRFAVSSGQQCGYDERSLLPEVAVGKLGPLFAHCPFLFTRVFKRNRSFGEPVANRRNLNILYLRVVKYASRSRISVFERIAPVGGMGEARTSFSILDRSTVELFPSGDWIE